MAKNILKSSDESNFILNITEEQYSKIASVGLVAACFSTSVATILPEIWDTQTYSASSIGFIVSGIFCFIMALISAIRKFSDKKLLLPIGAFGFMVLWGLVSLLDSYDKNIGFYGYTQRGEGLLAIIFYFSIFMTAASLKRKKALRALMLGIILSGWLNSIVAMIQIFTKKMSHYNTISIKFLFAPSGLAQSPVFLSMVLALSLTSAAVMAMLDESAKMRIFGLLSTCLFAFVALNTFTIMGYAALGLSVIAAIAAVIINKSPKIRLLWLAAPVLFGVIAVLLIEVGTTAYYLEDYKLADGRILWTGDSYKRVSACGDYDPNSVDIDDTYDVYYYMNRKSIDIVKKFPLTGTGPEQLVFPQLYTKSNALGAELTELPDILAENKGTFDKVYNEYIYTAATRGIPSLIALLLVILPVIVIGFKTLMKNKTLENTGLFLITVVGALVFLIGCSNITFSPIFWAAAGACCTIEEKVHVGEKKKKAKKAAKK